MNEQLRVHEAEHAAELQAGLEAAREAYHRLQNARYDAGGLYEDDLFLGALALADVAGGIPTEAGEVMLAGIESVLSMLSRRGTLSQPAAECLRARQRVRRELGA